MPAIRYRPEIKDSVGPIGRLNNLFNVLDETSETFSEAAEKLDDASLAEMCEAYAKQYSEFGASVANMIVELSSEPEEEVLREFGSDIKRAWMDLRAALAGSEAAAILESLEEANEEVVEAYDILFEFEADLSSGMRSELHEQYEAVTAAQERLEELEDAFD
jgi:uncharacterized protein (TIGR02284 family)